MSSHEMKDRGDTALAMLDSLNDELQSERKGTSSRQRVRSLIQATSLPCSDAPLCAHWISIDVVVFSLE